MDVVPSPCTKVCSLDPASGACQGCGRTLDEIAGWMRFSPDEKRRVIALGEARLADADPDRTAGRRV